MRIYKMTATFGKLEQATLELKPGLNIITAPNEWGKSTWCAFLCAMLYGLDTHAKTTKTTIADKEKYLPWSGSPMAGRIDLNWKGRDITIERRTGRRIPLGEFRAYETASGLSVPELTADNCGRLLLGVEQSVFRRAGFIRQADLPVTQDEALRRRLNALVTTGDDSGAADRLAEQLKELKNRCRYNRTGLLPQAEAERDALVEKLEEMDDLETRMAKQSQRIREIRQWLEQLGNHRQAMAYARMQADLNRVEEARQVLEAARKELEQLEAVCRELPSQEEAERKVRELRAFRELWNGIQEELDLVPEEPRQPQLPYPFTGCTEEEARAMADRDAREFAEMSGSGAPVLLMAVGVLGLVSALVLIFLRAYVFAAVAVAAGLAALVWGILEKRTMKARHRALLEKYGSPNWKHWTDPVADYQQELAFYRVSRKEYEDICSDLEVRLMVLRGKRESLCGPEEPEALLERWQKIQEQWSRCHAARREALRAGSHYETLRSMLRPVEKPAMEDRLTHSEEETARLLTECALEQQRLQNRLGQYQGRMEVLGDRTAARNRLEKVNRRIARLEDTYSALVIAMETLAQAREELQRRFAPRITRRAQEYMSRMTGGRYHSITMGVDFSLRAGAGQEETLRELLWRSDGTMDQLYLSLRLAVAQELTPGTPLVLDDALVRFDDERMAAALKILEQLSRERQVICFTCQKRESEL